MCVCAINNISHSHPHCKWIGFGEQKITVAFSLKKKLLLSEEKSKEWKLHKKFCFGNKVPLVINKNRSKISFMYLFSGATGFLPSLRLEVATGVESLRKPCQPSSHLMASGPPSPKGWGQLRELTHELLGDDQEAELHPRRSTPTLGKTLCMCVLTVKRYGLWYHRKRDNI